MNVGVWIESEEIKNDIELLLVDSIRGGDYRRATLRREQELRVNVVHDQFQRGRMHFPCISFFMSIWQRPTKKRDATYMILVCCTPGKAVIISSLLS